MPTRVLQQPITRRVTDRSDIDTPGGIAIYGGFEFNRDLHECFDPLDSVMIVGTVETDKSMVAMTAMSKADLAIIELDFGGELAGLSVARAIAANSPACGIMIYTPALTPRGFKRLWVYGSEQWSIITRASLANPAHIRATVKSVVRGMPWTEPGVQRQWAELRGPSPAHGGPQGGDAHGRAGGFASGVSVLGVISSARRRPPWSSVAYIPLSFSPGPEENERSAPRSCNRFEHRRR